MKNRKEFKNLARKYYGAFVSNSFLYLFPIFFQKINGVFSWTLPAEFFYNLTESIKLFLQPHPGVVFNGFDYGFALDALISEIIDIFLFKVEPFVVYPLLGMPCMKHLLDLERVF